MCKQGEIWRPIENEEVSKQSDESAMATAAAFHLDFGDGVGGRKGSTSGRRAAGAKGGNEVAVGFNDFIGVGLTCHKIFLLVNQGAIFSHSNVYGK